MKQCFPAKQKSYVHGLGAIDLVEHRVKQFEVLVQYDNGSNEETTTKESQEATLLSDKPVSYEEKHPQGTDTVTHKFRGEDFRHGFRDTRNDREMLADLNRVATILKAHSGKSCAVCTLS